jgi:hypothetical protein
MDFEVVGQIQNIEPIAVGRGIHDRSRLNKLYGKGRWRKLKGFARVRLPDDTIHKARFTGTKPTASGGESSS